VAFAAWSINIDHGIGAEKPIRGIENVTRGSVARIAGRGRVDEERMKLTDISQSGLLSLKWWIASGLVRRITPVPEYIRLIRRGPLRRRLHDQLAFQRVPRDSRGAPATRPCEPACRRVRVEDEPVAICRLKRVASDYKEDIPPACPSRPRSATAKRIALVAAARPRSRLRATLPRTATPVWCLTRIEGGRHDALAEFQNSGCPMR